MLFFTPLLEEDLALQRERLGLSDAEFQQLQYEYGDDEELLLELQTRPTPLPKRLNLEQWLDWHGWKQINKTHCQRVICKPGFFQAEQITEIKPISDLIEEHLAYAIATY